MEHAVAISKELNEDGSFPPSRVEGRSSITQESEDSGDIIIIMIIIPLLSDREKWPDMRRLRFLYLHREDNVP